ncbi:hypothetical protein BOX15_Mlig017016g2, partial [Macrostomum lignano]
SPATRQRRVAGNSRSSSRQQQRVEGLSLDIEIPSQVPLNTSGDLTDDNDIEEADNSSGSTTSTSPEAEEAEAASSTAQLLKKARQARSPVKNSNPHQPSVEGGPAGMGDLSAQSLGEMSSQDRRSVLLLTFLYVLQGIPLGLAGSVPYILTARKVSYTAQGTFSFVFWPFSLKLLWAPLVDSIYSARFGRRKSWLIPVQFGLAAAMTTLASYTDWLLGENPPGPVRVLPLAAGFFSLTFLAATQDIAVDGWALTMLSRRNVAWASGCNSVGQTAGYFIAYVLFLALESADFCNTWLRSRPEPVGLVSLSGFLRFWGLVFLGTTFCLLFRREESTSSSNSSSEVDNDNLGVRETYAILAKVMRLRPVLLYLFCLCLLKSAFAAADGMTGLKLIEAGVPKERLALLGVVVTPFQLVLPVLLSRHVGNRPLSLYTKSALPRLLLGLLFAGLVWITPRFKSAHDASYPWHYFLLVTVAYLAHQVFMYAMFVSQMAFHAKVSDPNVGGTYMTLLNTVTNLAGSAPVTFLLFVVDYISIKSCSTPSLESESSCITLVDGYYIQSGLCFILGIVVLLRIRATFRRLESLPLEHWKVT